MESDESQFRQLENNLAFASYISKLVMHEVNRQTTVTTPLHAGTPVKEKTGAARKGIDLVQSPSDTTIYQPVLQKEIIDKQLLPNVSPKTHLRKRLMIFLNLLKG